MPRVRHWEGGRAIAIVPVVEIFHAQIPVARVGARHQLAELAAPLRPRDFVAAQQHEHAVEVVREHGSVVVVWKKVEQPRSRPAAGGAASLQQREGREQVGLVAAPDHQLQLGKVQKQAVVASGDEGVRMLFELARRDNTRQIVKHVGDPTFRIIVEFQ
tara:strand:+ start:605 stop:1081 length:477 start_codon:yes stop_codon:yes gene_type:complete